MAYVNPQVQLDLQQDERNRQNQASIGNAFLKGLQSIDENRRRALDESRKQFANDMQYAALGVTPTDQEATEIKNSGYSKSLLDRLSEPLKAKQDRELVLANAQKSKALYEAGQLSKPVQERDDYIKSIDSAKARSEISSSVVADRMAAQEEQRIAAEARKLENEKKGKIQEAQIQDFDLIDSNIIPSSKDAETVKGLNASNKSFQGLGTSVSEKLLKADPRNPAYYISNDWKLLQQDLTKMKLQAKNLEDLGVLNGPDLGLVNETLGSITPSTLAILGPQKAAERVKAAMDNSQKVLMNAASSRNYKPKPTRPQEQISPDDQAAIQWAQQNKNDPRAAQILQLHGVK